LHDKACDDAKKDFKMLAVLQIECFFHACRAGGSDG